MKRVSFIFITLLGCVQSQLTCPDVFCPSQPTTCTCQVTGGVLAWSIQYPNGTIVGSTSHVRGASQFVLNTQYPLADVVNNDVPFSSTLTNTTNPVIIADLSFTVDMSYNGYRIVCSDGVNPLTETISILDPPNPTSTPHSLSFAAINFSSANLTWDISSVQQCLTGYRLVINGSEIINISSVPAVGSESFILNDRTRGIQYCYTVSVVDTGNRVGPSSDSQCFTLDTPLQPILGQPSTFHLSDDLSDPTNFTLEWMQPASSRPPVTSYQVIHNISNTGDNVTTTVPSPTITITGATLGSTYSILITPSNTLGEGPAAYTIVIPSSSTIPVSSSVFITSSLSVIPIESPSEPSSCCACNEYVPVTSVAISVPITAILTAVVASIVSSLVTYYCCWLKSKGSNSYSPSGPYDIPPGGGGGVVPTRGGLELKDNMAYGQVTGGSGPPPIPAEYETVHN